MKWAKQLFCVLAKCVRYLFFFWLARAMRETRHTSAPIWGWLWICQKVFRINGCAYWPVYPTSCVRGAKRITVGVESAPGLSRGGYVQGSNGIVIGDYVLIAPNVGIISSNHDLYDYRKHVKTPPIRIDDYCWLGMGCVILPGVHLGAHTVVAAGAVVNKSFSEGYCVLGGVPARKIKELDRDKVVECRNVIEYIGYHRLTGTSKSELYRRLGVQVAADGGQE